MSKVKPLRVGIVGCGQIAQEQHIPYLGKIKGAEIVAICDRNEGLARRVSARFHISNYYTDFSEMLDKEKLDMVDICTTPQTHPALSILALMPWVSAALGCSPTARILRPGTVR